MYNLAGCSTVIVDKCVKAELLEAGISIIEDMQKNWDVRSSYFGVLQFRNGQVVTFVRAWYYWVVNSRYEYPMPYDVAFKLNEEWRSQIRVEGCAQGTDVPQRGVSEYHVDSQVGLNHLVDIYKSVFGEVIEPSPLVLSNLVRLGVLRQQVSGYMRE